jgi:ketosteroid isomerase-like protein
VNEHPNAARVRSAYEAVVRGDMATFADALDDHIVWHESMPGFEGDYRGRDEALALLGRVFEQTGMELNDLAIDHVLADDSHAMVLLETTVTLGGRRQTSQYVDVYRLHDGKATEHWHLPLDQRAEESFFAG